MGLKLIVGSNPIPSTKTRAGRRQRGCFAFAGVGALRHRVLGATPGATFAAPTPPPMPAPKTTPPPPAYFLSLSLENVRSFGEKQTIHFTEGGKEGGKPAQWTVILGDNGVGKTTVLRALAAMRPIESKQGEHQFRLAYVVFDNGDWTLLTKNDNASRARVEAKVHAELMAGEGHSFSLQITQFMMATICNVPDFDEAQSVANLVCYGYGASRTTGNSVIGENPADADTCASLFDDRADLLDPQEWFLNVDYGSRLVEPQNTSLADARKRVEQMLIAVLPGVTALKINLAGTPQKPQISLQFLLHGTWVKLRDLSLGYQTLVVWLTDFASKLYIRYPDSKNPLAEPAIVLIDEIDLHLHPAWQRTLLADLSKIFPNTQFIATAHSPLVVQAAGDAGANVVLLRREGDHTIVVPDLEDVRGWRIDQIMTSELFGLETARSLGTEKKLQRRAELLTKTKRTAAEKKELEALTRELDAEPLGETPSEREVHAVLQELRQRLAPKGLDASAA